MEPHRPVLFQTWIANGQAKKTWAKSSYPELQLAQFVGHVTPLSSSRTRVGKQPLQMRQIRFFTFGGTWRFQIQVQYPGRHK